jgi:hypothetical protein
MNILLASSYFGIHESITKDSFKDINGTKFTVADNVNELLLSLKTKSYDLIIAEFSLGLTDIWRIAKLIYSAPMKQYAIPLLVIKETCPVEVPPILFKEHNIHLTSLDNLEDDIKRISGYFRSQKDSNTPVEIKPSVLIIEDDEHAAELLALNLIQQR